MNKKYLDKKKTNVRLSGIYVQRLASTYYFYACAYVYKHHSNILIRRTAVRNKKLRQSVVHRYWILHLIDVLYFLSYQKNNNKKNELKICSESGAFITSSTYYSWSHEHFFNFNNDNCSQCDINWQANSCALDRFVLNHRPDQTSANNRSQGYFPVKNARLTTYFQYKKHFVATLNVIELKKIRQQNTKKNCK